MSSDPRMIIVADDACDACGTLQAVVHHQTFPAMRIKGVSVEDAAKNLAIRLESNLSAVSDPMHREPVQLAIADVQAFLDKETIPRPQPKISAIIDVGAAAPVDSPSTPSLLVKSETLELRRLNLPKGQEIPTHHARGEITVQCLVGRIAFTADGETRELRAGQLIVLAPGAPHSLVGLEDSSVLVTKVLLVCPSDP